jgi:hypothetical protein
MPLLSILIFRDINGAILYKGFASKNEIDVNDFMDKIYNEINYEPETPLDNTSKYGELLEHHTRNVDILPNTNKVYFSLYQHEYTKYLCIHNKSPVFFEQSKADEYIMLQPELISSNCELIMI